MSNDEENKLKIDNALKELEDTLKSYHKSIMVKNPYAEFELASKRISESRINVEHQLPLLELKNLLDSIDRDYNVHNSYSIRIKKTIKGINGLRTVRSKLENIDLEKNEANHHKIMYLVFILNTVIESVYPEVTFKNEENFFNFIESFEQQVSEKFFFRGQSNSKWNIIPSSFRGIDQSTTSIYTLNTLQNQYIQIGVSQIYDQVINNRSTMYEKSTFLQHAISFSPLIDFTKNIIVATYFALNNHTQINNFLNEDSAIYILRTRENETIDFDEKLQNIKIGIYKDKSRDFNDYMTIYNNMGRFFGNDSEIYFSLEKTNDRMKYQSGLFVLFDNYIIDDINKTVLFDRSNKYTIIKVIIDKSIKSNIRSRLLRQYPDYNLKYLMNPYSRFEES